MKNMLTPKLLRAWESTYWHNFTLYLKYLRKKVANGDEIIKMHKTVGLPQEGVTYFNIFHIILISYIVSWLIAENFLEICS